MRAPVWGILLALAVAACSGGNAAIPHTPPGGTPSHVKVTVNFKIRVPGVRRAPHDRRQRQLSPRLKRVWSIAANTAGIQILAYASGNRNNPLGTTVANISAGSAKCSASDPYGGRTCTLDLQAPPGNDDFVATTYDRAPAGGAIPSNAKQLGYGVATKTIAAGTAANVPLVLAGVLAKIQLGVTPDSLHTILPATETVNVYALDADNDAIVTDAFIDASGNPITVSLSVDNTLPLANAASSSASLPSLTLNPSTISAPRPAGVALTYAPQANGILAASNQTVTISASPSASSVTAASATLAAIAPSYFTITGIGNLNVHNPYHGGIAFGPTSSYSDDIYFTSPAGNGAMNECTGCTTSSASVSSVNGTIAAPIYGGFAGTGTAFSGSTTMYAIAGNSCETVSSGPALNPCSNSSPAPIPNGSGMVYDAADGGVWYASGTNVAFYNPNGSAPITASIGNVTIGGFALDSTNKAWLVDTADNTLAGCTVNIAGPSMTCSTGTSLGVTPFDILDVTNAAGTERLLVTDTGSRQIHVRDLTGASVANVTLPAGTTPWYLMPDNVTAGVAWFDYLTSSGAIGIGRIDTNRSPPTILMATGPVGPIYSSSASPAAGAMGTSPGGYVYTVFDDAQQLVRWTR